MVFFFFETWWSHYLLRTWKMEHRVNLEVWCIGIYLIWFSCKWQGDLKHWGYILIRPGKCQSCVVSVGLAHTQHLFVARRLLAFQGKLHTAFNPLSAVWVEAVINVVARVTERVNDWISVIFKKPKGISYVAVLLIALLVFKTRTLVGNKNSCLGQILCGGVHKRSKFRPSQVCI